MYNYSDFLFVPLGGSGEIGMNANLYHYEGSWLMVDLGISFPDDSMPGIDVVLPDLSFIEARREQLAGLVLTHGHEDHLGAIPYLWRKIRCPIYATPFACGLLRRKLEDVDLLDQVDLTEIPVAGSVDIGPFTVDLISAAHSVPEANILSIRTGAGIIVHATDWKIDPKPLVGRRTDEDALRKLGYDAAKETLSAEEIAAVPNDEWDFAKYTQAVARDQCAQLARVVDGGREAL